MGSAASRPTEQACVGFKQQPVASPGIDDLPSYLRSWGKYQQLNSQKIEG